MSVHDERAIILAIYNDSIEDSFTTLQACLKLQLQPSDFIESSHGMIYKIYTDKLHKNKDEVTLKDLIINNQSIKVLENIITDSFLPEIKAQDVAYYVGNIKTKVKKDELMAHIKTLESECLNFDWEKDDFLDFYTEKIDGILSFANSAKDKKTHHISESLKQFMDSMASDENFMGIKTGFQKIDEKIVGLCAGQLIVIGARPAVGKTTFALSLMLEIAKLKPDIRVFFFSLEMTGQELSSKMISNLSGISSERFKSARFKEGDHKKITKAIDDLNQFDIEINEDGGSNVPMIASYCRNAMSIKPINLIIIDYLQLLPAHTKDKNRLQQITAITCDLKALAKELKCPIILLSQLNRSVESRGESGVPAMSDLRESGSIEQDADIVMLLHRKKNTLGQLLDGEIHVNIAKNRSGQTGEVLLKFEGAFSRVSN